MFVIYSGTPDAGAFWRMIEQYKVRTLFTAPTALRAIKRADHHGDLLKNYNISTLQAIFLAGEHADPDTVKWAERTVGAAVRDHWWQTETGWPICSNLIGVDGIEVFCWCMLSTITTIDLIQRNGYVNILFVCLFVAFSPSSMAVHSDPALGTICRCWMII